jgi:mono/diheme cytochrome c family protein
MSLFHPAGALFAVVALVSQAAIAEPVLSFESARIDPPDRGVAFAGPGSDALNNNCIACHSAGMVMNQPPLPAATWKAEVEKMIHTYKAPVDEKDVQAIVDYLASIKGAK